MFMTFTALPFFSYYINALLRPFYALSLNIKIFQFMIVRAIIAMHLNTNDRRILTCVH